MTLKTLEKIREAVERRPQELAEARQKGDKVCGYFCSMIPEERDKAKGAPRIMLSGTIIPPGDTKLIQMIEEMGGKIVADDLCSGFRFHGIPAPREYSIHGLADAYIGRIPCGSLPHLSLDTDRRLKNLFRMISDYKVEGMIYHTLRY